MFASVTDRQAELARWTTSSRSAGPLETPVSMAEGGAQSSHPGPLLPHVGQRGEACAVDVAEWVTGGLQWPELP
jgi:hypothetical protein